jgi:NADH-quinone oxidoreductase subunit M
MLNSFEKARNIEVILNFTIYSMSSALLILVAMVMIYFETGTSNIKEIYEIGVKNATTFWILFIGIAIKTPIWPFYYWLPIVHVKSSTSCSVVLASIVLKYSSLLIIRLLLPIFNEFFTASGDILFSVFVISILFAFSQAIRQNDLKKIFAYFSIIHMNMGCIMLLGNVSLINFIFSIISHSFVIAFMFFITSIINSTFKSRIITELKNMNINSKEIKWLFFISILSLIGVPGFCGFISEMLCINSIAKISVIYLVVISIILLFSSVYLFRLYCYIFCNTNKLNADEEIASSEIYKKTSLYLTLAIIILFGIAPCFILDRFSQPCASMV